MSTINVCTIALEGSVKEELLYNRETHIMSDKLQLFVNFVAPRLPKESDRGLLRLLQTCAVEGRCATEAEVQNAARSTKKAPAIIYSLRHHIEGLISCLPRGIPNFQIPNGLYRLQLSPNPPQVHIGDLMVPVPDFSRLITAMCQLIGVDEQERTRRFWKWHDNGCKGELCVFAESITHEHSHPVNAVIPTSFDTLLRLFGTRRKQIGAVEMRNVAREFMIRPVLLDPLLSEPVIGSSLSIDMSDFVHVVEGMRRLPDESEEDEAEHAEYFVPNKRLADADAAIGRVRLAPSGRSEHHAHPGDEIVFVRSGKAEVHFTQSGMRIHLNEYELMHFHAEAYHRIVNPTKKQTELLIIRFYQADPPGVPEHLQPSVVPLPSRHKLWKDLTAVLTGICESDLHPHAASWIRQVLPTYRQSGPRIVADELGLARFLEDCAAIYPADHLDRTYRHGIETARPEVIEKLDSLSTVANDYHTQEFLLRHFSYPAVSGAIILRAEDYAAPDDDRSASDRCLYHLPIRNLSCSDTSIAKVQLGCATGQTRQNAHPGFEFILMLKGSVRIQFSDSRAQPITLSASDGPEMCHFDSTIPHQIFNINEDVEASFMVFRFYRDGARRGLSNYNG